MPAHCVAKPLGNEAQILADNKALVALCFDLDDGQQRLKGLTDIAAGATIIGQPETAVQAKRMINTNDACVFHGLTNNPS